MDKIIDINASNVYKFGTLYKPKTKVNQVHLIKKNTEVESVFFKIIIPNYNNMPYIKKCLDSILNLTFQDFKIIIVDDLSTDLSDKFCEMYARKHLTKIVFHQLKKKGYAGAARNWAIDYNLNSQYIWFIDSDDWLYDNKVLERMHTAIINANMPDVLECAYILHYTNKDIITKPQQHITDIMKHGAWPLIHCVKTKVCKHFKENRAKNNDIVWFARTFDNVNPIKITNLSIPCGVYNRESVTSCQNSSIVSNSLQCLYAQSLVYSDISQEKFKTKHCIEFQAYIKSIFNQYNQVKHLLLQDVLKNAFVISINKKKYNDFVSIFLQCNLLPIPTLSYGSCNTKLSGPLNCTKSHLTIVLHAKNLHLPYVLIFEDDAYPCINCKLLLSLYIDLIPNDAGLVLLGWSNHNQVKRKDNRFQPFDKPFNKIQTIISGSHSYILFSKAYDEYIQFFNTHKNETADCFIFKHISNGYVLNSPLFIQYSGNASMNKHIGYIFYGDHANPPLNFPNISIYLLNKKVIL